MKIRVADFIAQTLVKKGIKDIFLITGGGAMHLNDAIGRCKDLRYTCCHHEQACAIAAEGYFRLSNHIAAINVTSGPGGTNAITGVFSAWVDSIGMMVLSGNVKWETLVKSTGLPLRQLGDQEADIVKIVQSITKYSVCVTDPHSIRYHLEKALYLAKSGRPGPVWLDIPLNVQGAKVDPSELHGYDPKEDQILFSTNDLKLACQEILNRLSQSNRPVILAGSGIRISGAANLFLKFLERVQVPVTTAWNAHDLIWNDHPYYVGRPGIVGDRPGNFAVQNADFLLILGSRLSIRQVSYDWKKFARHAFKVMVDVDQAELQKPTLQIDLPVHANLVDVFPLLLELPYSVPRDKHLGWLNWCLERKRKYPVILPEYREQHDRINPYYFVEELFKFLPENEVVVTGDGTACVVAFQAAYLKKGQRLFHNSGCAPMGFDLPAAIGACLANDKKRVVCLAGDGSIQMNIQELQTIVTHQFPIHIFILNNEGYHSIRQTQQNYFSDSPIGYDEASGVGFPNFEKLACAYGIPYRLAKNHAELSSKIKETLSGAGPQVCEIILDVKQHFVPKLASKQLPDGRMVSSPLEDMFPYLSAEELKSNMLVPLIDENPSR